MQARDHYGRKLLHKSGSASIVPQLLRLFFYILISQSECSCIKTIEFCIV